LASDTAVTSEITGCPSSDEADGNLVESPYAPPSLSIAIGTVEGGPP
jgi:hypothetical protein